MKTHQGIDERSLAFHRLIAEKLRADPSLLEIPRRNLQRWLKTCSDDVRPALLEWQEIIEEGDIARIIGILEERSDKARAMRQNSPFPGVMSTQERLAIIRQFRDRPPI